VPGSQDGTPATVIVIEHASCLSGVNLQGIHGIFAFGCYIRQHHDGVGGYLHPDILIQLAGEAPSGGILLYALLAPCRCGAGKGKKECGKHSRCQFFCIISTFLGF